MGIIMLNGVKYGGSGGSGGTGDYARKPITIFEGRLDIGSTRIDLSPYGSHIYTGLSKKIYFPRNDGMYYWGDLGGVYILVRLIGTPDGSVTYNRYIFEECFLALPETSGSITLKCGDRYCISTSICDYFYNNSIKVFPKDSDENKITNEGYVQLTISRTAACYNNFYIDIDASKSSSMTVQKIQLL